MLTFLIKSNQPTLSMSKRKLQIKQIVFVLFIGFSFLYVFFFMSSISKNFGFMILENQSFKVSTVNFNLTENNSARNIAFSRANTAEAASFN